MNREDVAMDVTVQNVEILRGRLEQAENLLQAVVDEHGELSCDLHEQIDIFLASQQGERNQCDGCQAGIPLVDGAHRMGRQGGYPDLMSCQKERYKHPEQAEDDIKKLIVLLRHGDAMPGEQDLAADHLERLLKAEQAEGAQGEREAFEAIHSESCDLTRDEDEPDCYKNKFVDEYWAGWKARAALAQPSPTVVRDDDLVPVPRGLLGSAMYAIRRQVEAPNTLAKLREYAYSRVQPSPAPELERPEVVGYVGCSAKMTSDGWENGPEYLVLAGEASDADKRYDVPLMTVAQHDRIVGALRAAHQITLDELHAMEVHVAQAGRNIDAAQARVAELECGTVYVEARMCSACGHGGVNDGADGLSACGHCEWTGTQPSADECPDCLRQNCMSVACPECGGLYELVAEANITAPVAQAGQVPDGVPDLCRFLAKLYCELDGLRYSTAKLPPEEIVDALIGKWPVLQGTRNQLNIKRISEQPYDESKLHAAIAAMLAAAPAQGE